MILRKTQKHFFAVFLIFCNFHAFFEETDLTWPT